MPVTFPSIEPTARNFTAPLWFTTTQLAQSGVITRRIWGSKPGQASLSLQFGNITDDNVAAILEAYDTAQGPIDAVTLPPIIFNGADAALQAWLTQPNLQWGFDERSTPQVESVAPGRSNVQVTLIAYLMADPGEPPDSWSMLIEVSEADPTFRLVTTSSGGSVITIEWGDGDTETVTLSTDVAHTYESAGTYIVRVILLSGIFRPYYIGSNDRVKILELRASYPNWNFGASLDRAWDYALNLVSISEDMDISGVTDLTFAWRLCSSLASFPELNTSSVTEFLQTWQYCTSLISFPLIDTSSGVDFAGAWDGCTGLTGFPFIDVSNGRTFQVAWRNCSSLVNFPANLFDSWTGTPGSSCFRDAWDGCTSLSATSVENILNSIDTSGQSAPSSQKEITIDYNEDSGTPSISTAVANLKSRGWEIRLNNTFL